MTFNGTVEHRFGTSTTLTVSYAGNNGIHLFDLLENFNQLNPTYQSLGNQLSLPSGSAAGQAALASVGRTIPWPTFPASQSVAQALLPWPQYKGFVETDNGNTGGHSTYNALQVSLSHPFSYGLWAQVSYTYSKQLDNTDGAILEGNGGNGFPGNQNMYDLRAAKAVGSMDVPHDLALSYIYQIPVGKGMRFLSGARGITNALLGGWRLAVSRLTSNGYPVGIQSTKPMAWVRLNILMWYPACL